MSLPSLQDYLDAANDVYSQTYVSAPPGLTLINQADLNNLEDLSHGFFAQAFRDTSNNIIIAFEGTVPGLNRYGVGSLAADAKIAAGFNIGIRVAHHKCHLANHIMAKTLLGHGIAKMEIGG
jgi:hypothetical protein